MWSLVASAASSVGGLIAILIVVVGLMGVGAHEEHKLDESKLLKVEMQYKDAINAANVVAAQTQKTLDNDAIVAAQAAQAHQAAIAAEPQEIVRYVPITRVCVPLGLERVLRAAALGVSAGSVSIPAGKSDDACSAAGWRELAGPVVAAFQTCRANNAQLNDLINFMRQARKEVK